MNKQGLIDFTSEDASITKKDAKLIVETVLEGLRLGLINDGKVSLVGFGTLTTKTKPAHVGRNPKTGESIEVPEKVQVRFKPAAELKLSVQ